jgi:hypothetical protein
MGAALGRDMLAGLHFPAALHATTIIDTRIRFP